MSMLFVTTICYLYKDQQESELPENMRLNYRIDLIKTLMSCGVEMVVFAENQIVPLLGEIPNTVHIIPCELDEFSIYNSIMTTDLVLPQSRHGTKDRLEYFALMASKPEMVYKAKNLFPGYSHYVWIDGGIFKILSDRALAQNLIKNIHTLNIPQDKMLLAAGMQPRQMPNTPTVVDYLYWRFLGGIYITPLMLVDKFYHDNLSVLNDLLSINRITWEINIWATIESMSPDLFAIYNSKHDMTMLSNLHTTYQSKLDNTNISIDLSNPSKPPFNPSTLLKMSIESLASSQNENASALCEHLLAIPELEQSIKIHAMDVISISGYYSNLPRRKTLGRLASENLYLNRSVPYNTRISAGVNGSWYARSAKELMPSTVEKQINWKCPIDYTLINPCISTYNGRLITSFRATNYITNHETHETNLRGENCIISKIYLLDLDNNLDVVDYAEVQLPTQHPPIVYERVKGFEECRIFTWQGELWSNSKVRQFDPLGKADQVLAKIEKTSTGYQMTNCRIMNKLTADKIDQSNWLAYTINDELRFIWMGDPTTIYTPNGDIVDLIYTEGISTEWFKGGSPLIPFDGGWLTMVHEKHVLPPNQRIRYLNRFLWFNNNMQLIKCSEQFWMKNRALEYVAGITIHPVTGDLIAGVTVDELTNYFFTFKQSEVKSILIDVNSILSRSLDYRIIDA